MAEPYIGEIRIVSFNFAPKGWFDCNGQMLQAAQFKALFSVLGTRYGGDGKTTFALPNFPNAAAVGQGQGPGLTAYKVGDAGGASQVILNEAQLAGHTHQGYASRESADVQAPGPDRALARSTPGNAYQGEADAARMAPAATSTVGKTEPHNNMPPSLVFRFCIAYEGVYPDR